MAGAVVVLLPVSRTPCRRLLALVLVLTLTLPATLALRTDPSDTAAALDTPDTRTVQHAGPPTVPTDPAGSFLFAATLAGLDADTVAARAEATRTTPPAELASLDAAAAYHDLLDALAPYDLVDTTDPLHTAPAADPWHDLPAPARTGLAILLDGLADATRLHTEATGGLDVETARLLDQAWRASRTAGDRTLLESAFTATGGLPDGLDRTGLAASAHRILLAAADARPHLEAAHSALADDDATWPSTRTAGSCVEDLTGLIIVCGPSDDTIAGDRLLALDLGGDDHHTGNAGGAGLNVLWSGNNDLPVALSFDVAGDDTYRSDGSVQATGSTASGILLDLEGHDDYLATDPFFTFAQGAGNLGGVGFLHDALGDDTYETPGELQEGGDPAWDSQGFGILGGIGALVDPLGDDVYLGGIMAQGVGDFDAMGMLLDGAGIDRYSAEGRSQAFGDGIGLGVFWDASGGDRYRMHGPYGQGASLGGHALFVDLAGADDYTGAGPSRGHGEAGPTLRAIQEILWLLGVEPAGTAAFVDGHGDDDYHDGPGCALCVWTGGTGGVGADLGS